jgi:hypothetical protein
MPSALRFYLYLLVTGAAAFVLAVWLTPLGAVVNLLFAVGAAYLVIVVGRRVHWSGPCFDLAMRTSYLLAHFLCAGSMG